MDIERIIDIEASREQVWTVMTDVERWPEWTASVTSVALLDAAPFDVGSHARLRQPRRGLDGDRLRAGALLRVADRRAQRADRRWPSRGGHRER